MPGFTASQMIPAAVSSLSALKGMSAEKRGQKALAQNMDWAKNLIPEQWVASTPVGGFGMTPDGRVINAFQSPFRDSLASMIPGYNQLFWQGEQFNPFQQQLTGLGADLAGLRDKVAPGYSQLRDVRRSALSDAHAQRMGNLRNTINQRRLTGSSFGNQAESIAEADYARAREEADAKTFLEEFAATTGLINQEAEMAGRAMNALLARLTQQAGALQGAGQIGQIGLQGDLEIMNQTLGGLARTQQFLSNMANIISGNAIAQGEMASQSAQGWGTLAGQFGSQIFPKKNPYLGETMMLPYQGYGSTT